jgi:DNA topoisomerase-3
MTGEWEAELKRIERGEADAVAFERRIECFVQEVVASTLVAERGARPAVAHQVQGSLFGVEAESSGGHPPAPGDAPAERAAAPGRGSPDGGVKERETGRRGPPREQASSIAPSARRSRATAASPSRPRGADLPALLAGVFGHPAFRPLQEEVAQQVVAGRDVLLVMPTGAGKSLCYQLPGLARGGTTLVVSPLIALMEDQVAKLQELGVRAERIHSGRGARESRRVYSAYVAEALEFLYVAPERLGVSGFPELLARRPPSLVAIDEAHCISHWGHDFRPDYRLLGERLPQLRPAPVVALTATATPRVQQDIVDQLGLRDAHRFIHGFRRSNIAIELAEVRPSGRAGIVDRVLADSERRPAIVYAPSRKETERLAGRLGERMSAAAYHAGMTPRSRDRVQERFLTGDVEVMVATIAFGMGVDKPDIRTVVHTGLPGSVEGYYQEIGRAGRDGNPSRALLLYSWADRRMHEFFHGRDYPDPAELDVVARKLAVEPEPLESLRRRTPLDDDTFDKALEKLWIHGGARIAPDPESMQETVARAEGEWRRPYVEQRQWRLEQLEEITRFTGGHGCRMVELVRHFGDQNDDGSRCGVCDVCVPDETVAHEQRRPTGDEIAVMETVLEHLGRRDGLATGRLYRQVKEIHGSVERGELEDLLHGLASARLVDVRRDSFTKGAERIHYQRVCLTRTARRQGREALADVRLTVTAGEPAAGGGATRRTRRRRATAPPEREASPGLVAALKEWRLAESRRRRVPAFRILTNRALEALAAAAPGNEEELLAVHGIGPAVARQYGRELLRLVRDAPRGATP